MNKRKSTLVVWSFLILGFLFSVIIFIYENSSREIPDSSAAVDWENLSSKNNQLPKPLGSNQQTASLVLDADKDGKNDFFIASRSAANSVVWYRKTASGWTQYVVESASLRLEAGGSFYDIDGDGDLDIAFSGDNQLNGMFWWENPYPNYSQGINWSRHSIKNSGANKHHDQAFGDVDGDGKAELVFWNQSDPGLFVAEIPDNPKSSSSWPRTKIYTSTPKHEGLTLADLDLDGKLDIVGGGLWFKHQTGTTYQQQVIDNSRAFTRVAVGQLIAGGRPEVVLSAGDEPGTLDMYSWNGSSWTKKFLTNVTNGHTLEVVDVNKDGNPDIFSGEMRLNGANSNAKIRIFFGDGNGNFTIDEVATGYGIHEGKVADLDGDGDLDILAKPYNWETPRIDIWLQNFGSTPQDTTAPTSPPGGLDSWQKHSIDSAVNRKMLAVDSLDVDKDGKKDIVSGSYWWKQPTSLSGTWQRNNIAAGFDNFMHIHQSGSSVKLLGTKGSSHNSKDLVWAVTSSGVGFSLDDITPDPTEGDFTQGIAEVTIAGSADKYIALSWHKPENHNMQFLNSANKSLTITSNLKSQNEGLTAGDIDADGKVDLFQGTKWLRNNGALAGWTQHVVDLNLSQLDNDAIPDRNELADFDKDGDLDAIVALELGTQVLLYKNPGNLNSNPNQAWQRSVIYTIPGQGFSMDSGDIDGDGDVDIVLGEHRGASQNRVIILENKNNGSVWTEHIIDSGPSNQIDHHVGTKLNDIDNDGDLDILSIGWTNQKVWLYENTSTGVSPTTSPTTVQTGTPTTSPSETINPSPTSSGEIICGAADSDGDGKFTLDDFVDFASLYLDSCSDTTVNYGACGGKDTNKSGKIDLMDLTSFARRYYPRTSCAL